MTDTGNTRLVSRILCEFKDIELEREFAESDIKGAIRYVKPILLILGVLYFLFMIPDSLLIREKGTLALIFGNRLLFLALILVFYLRIRFAKDFRFFYRWVTAYEILASVLFLTVYLLYDSPDFIIQAFGVMVILLAAFIIPNRFIYMVFSALFISAAFFLISAAFLKDIAIGRFSAAVVYITLVILLSGISSYRTGYYKRIQYANSRELQKLSNIDSLTGVYNRHKFNEELRRGINYAQRYRAELSIVMYDFDDFKKINDAFGHPAGDATLVEAAGIVRNSVRNTDVLARWGGEEFILLLPGTGKEQASELAHRLQEKIGSHPFSVGRVTCSFGVAVMDQSDTEETLVKRADIRLYAAKKAGKNRVEV